MLEQGMQTRHSQHSQYEAARHASTGAFIANTVTDSVIGRKRCLVQRVRGRRGFGHARYIHEGIDRVGTSEMMLNKRLETVSTVHASGACEVRFARNYARLVFCHVTAFSAGVNPYLTSLPHDTMHPRVIDRHGLVAILLE